MEKEKEYGITFTNFSHFCKFNQRLVFGDKIIEAGCALNSGNECKKDNCKVFVEQKDAEVKNTKLKGPKKKPYKGKKNNFKK